MKQIDKTLLTIGGFDLKTSAECSSNEINKMKIISSLILVPALLALFSWGYACKFVFNSALAAITGGLVMATIILTIDRSIVAYGKPGEINLSLLGRFLLAVAAGFLVAEPLLIKVFEDSITEQQVLELRTQKGNITEYYDNKQQELYKTLEKDKKQLNSLHQAYTEEMDGTGGSGIRNKGPIFQQKLADYNDFKLVYEQKENEVKNEIAEQVKEEINELTKLENNKANGLIGKIRALHNLGERELSVRITSWVLRIFLCLIELIPLFIKISPTKDQRLYYRIADHQDKEHEELFLATKEERMRTNEKRIKFFYLQEFTELSNQEILFAMNSTSKNSSLYMNTVRRLFDKKIEIQNDVKKAVKDEIDKKNIIKDLDKVFEQQIEVLRRIIYRPNYGNV